MTRASRERALVTRPQYVDWAPTLAPKDAKNPERMLLLSRAAILGPSIASLITASTPDEGSLLRTYGVHTMSQNAQLALGTVQYVETPEFERREGESYWTVYQKSTPETRSILEGLPEVFSGFHEGISNELLYSPTYMYPERIRRRDDNVDVQAIIDDMVQGLVETNKRGVIPVFPYTRHAQNAASGHVNMTFAEEEYQERLEGIKKSRYVVRFGDAFTTIMPIVRAMDRARNPEEQTFYWAMRNSVSRLTTHWNRYDWIFDGLGEEGEIINRSFIYEYHSDHVPRKEMYRWLCEDDVKRIFSEPLAVTYSLVENGKTKNELAKNFSRYLFPART